MKRKYGWIKQKPDDRDIPLSLAAPPVLPGMADLRSRMPAVYDQGQTSSCTANAIAGAIQDARRQAGLPDLQPSRLFIYYNERVLEGDPTQDAGAEIRDGIKSCNAYNSGYCDEASWPFIESQVTVKPPPLAYTSAIKDVIHDYATVNNNNLIAMKQCLAHGFPFVFGFDVYQQFEDEGPGTISETGIVQMPPANATPIGGHAVVAVGYMDSKQMFIVRNSWGVDWGLQGYFLMPYQYMTSGMVSDAWVVRFQKTS